MAIFRVYAISDSGQISSPAQVIECLTDDDALELARSLFDSNLIEVWNGRTLVGHVPPRKKEA